MNEVDDFKRGMRRVAGTVAIITTSGPHDIRLGMTATAFCSLSTEPPSLLVCVNSSSSVGKAVSEGGGFAVNVLRPAQDELAQVFSGRTGKDGDARFTGLGWEPGKMGAPIHGDALVAFDCRIESIVRQYTHLILVGTVLRTILNNEEVGPLIYCEGGYRGWMATSPSG